MFLIGSQAIKQITGPFYRDIESSDLDLYCSQEEFNIFFKTNKIEKCFPLKKNKYRIKIENYPIIELKIYSKDSIYHWLSLEDQKDLLSDKKYYINQTEINIPNIQCLKAIKKSHLYWPIHWLKNINDYAWLKENSKPLNQKELLFQQKIKKEMQVLHGSIPQNKRENPNHLEWKEIIENMIMYDNYEKNVVYFIHYSLSLKNKIKIIENWREIELMLFFKNRTPKIL